MKLILAALCSISLVSTASATVHYVDLNCTNPVTPYLDWSTAATNIQDAIDVSINGDTVLVTNGVYATGGRKWFDSGTNRVTLTNAVTLQSVNGPAVTSIVGKQVAGTGLLLTNAVRCVVLGSSAVISGFTLTNGEAGFGNYPSGGGVMSANSISPAGVVTNCILIGNLATNSTGGGAYRVKLFNCQLIGNYASTGGGATACTLDNCLVVSNTASLGGGVYGNNTYGYSSLNNCTVVGNSASTLGGGVDNGSLGAMNNCIAYYNSAPDGSNYTGIKLNNCNTTPILASDLTSFTNAPLFANLAGGNFRLQSNSPCINSGNNSYVSVAADLDGNPRIAGGTVDIGAYEFQSPTSTLSYAWAQQFGLPTDGSVDQADGDGDGMKNWQEWIAGTSPTNAASLLQLQSPGDAASGVNVSWWGVKGKTYLVQRSGDAGSAFSAVRSNLFGQNATLTFTDTSATNGGPYFYRVGIQQ